ncbi:MAG: PadR family transcriptional regulator [Flavobacteriales bacterium]
MSLPHALLTALLEKAATGFELAKRFDRSMSYYWYATHQQIYRELARMQQAGWISMHEPAEKNRRKIYHIQPEGEAELQRWVGIASEATPLREDLMIKLRAEAILGALGVESQIQQRIEQHQQRLQIYQQLERQYFYPEPVTREQRLKHLILKTGMSYEHYCIQWLQEVLAVLAEKPDTPALP